MQLQEQIFKITKTKEKSEEKERVLFNTLDCMTELMEMKGFRVKPAREISHQQQADVIDCLKCEYKTSNTHGIQEH